MAARETDRVYLITGSDEASISAEAEQVVRRCAGPNPDAFTLDLVTEKDDTSTAETLRQVVRAVRSPAFLGGAKTVWLQHFRHFDTEGTKTSNTPEAMAFRELCEVITAGLPDDIVLVLDGVGADQRKALFKACKAHGRTTVCGKPDVRSRNWHAEMAKIVQARATEKGVSLPPDLGAYLIDALGTDTARIGPELEKLICYCGGPETPLTLAAAQAVCSGQGEAVSWALCEAAGNRDLPEALRVLDVLMRQEKDPDRAARGLILQIAGSYRQMLQIRVFMQDRHLRTPHQVEKAVAEMPEAEQAECLANGLEFARFHPYRVLMLARQALKYGGRELIRNICVLRDAYRKCVSSSAANRVVLEDTLIRLIGKSMPAVPGNRERRTGDAP